MLASPRDNEIGRVLFGVHSCHTLPEQLSAICWRPHECAAKITLPVVDYDEVVQHLAVRRFGDLSPTRPGIEIYPSRGAHNPNLFVDVSVGNPALFGVDNADLATSRFSSAKAYCTPMHGNPSVPKCCCSSFGVSIGPGTYGRHIWKPPIVILLDSRIGGTNDISTTCFQCRV